MQNGRIFIVDDDESWRFILRSCLDRLGDYDIVEAENGKDALQILDASPIPNLILTDFNMPYMSGDEFCAHLYGDSRFANVPVVLFSNDVFLENLAKSMAISGCISKSNDARAVTETLRGVLARNGIDARKVEYV
jgi:CheY-like chemotaxis protein